MTTWARKIDGDYVDIVTTDPSTLFHPAIAAQFVIIPDSAMTYDKPKKKRER